MDKLGAAVVRVRDAYSELQLRRRLNAVLAEPLMERSPEIVFRDCDDPFWLWINTEGLRRNKSLRKVLPSLPDEELQNRFTGSSGDVTLREAFRTYSLVKRLAKSACIPIGPTTRILDYGCGWGRTIRFFLKDVAPANLWGIDCHQQVIDICKQTNNWCNFRLVAPFPPTGLPDESFDLIYSYSVFSHLSEDAHLRWLAEFNRLLKPGGLLIATTWPRSLIVRCAEVRNDEHHPPWQNGLAASFLDTEQVLAAYDRGEYCHSPVGGGDVLEPSFFGETCIPKLYVAKHWAQYFHLFDYVDDLMTCSQNVIVVRK
jgi:SAM-dependent methyltransferase